MKTIWRTCFVFIVGTLLLGAASCTKAERPEVAAPAEDGFGTIELTVGGATTKTDIYSHTETLAYETSVNNLYVGVFGDDGFLSWCSTSMTAGTPQAATVRTGTNITIVAVANYPTISQLTACKSLSELNAKTVLLSDNSTNSAVGFVKVGRATGVALGNGGTVSKSITLQNLATRIVFSELTVDLDDDSFDFFQGKEFDPWSVFIENACGKIRLDGTSVNDTWHNINGRDADEAIINGDTSTSYIDLPQLLFSTHCQMSYFQPTEYSSDGYDDYGNPCLFYINYLERYIEDSDGVQNLFDDEGENGEPCVLYCFAPPATPTYDCKIVIEIKFTLPTGSWTPFYYPVSLSGIQPGRTYKLSLNVTKLGTLDPANTDWVPYINLSPGGDDDTPGGDIIIEW